MEDIKHEGIVLSSGPGLTRVRFEQNRACSGCKASGVCSSISSGERVIDIEGSYDLSPGAPVEVSIKKSRGYLALFLGYVLPLVILVTVLLILTSISAGELIAAFAAISATAVYYLVLYLSGNFISKKFTFRIQKL